MTIQKDRYWAEQTTEDLWLFGDTKRKEIADLRKSTWESADMRIKHLQDDLLDIEAELLRRGAKKQGTS